MDVFLMVITIEVFFIFFSSIYSSLHYEIELYVL